MLKYNTIKLILLATIKLIVSSNLCSFKTEKVLVKDNFFRCKCQPGYTGPYCRKRIATGKCIDNYQVDDEGQCSARCPCENGNGDVSKLCEPENVMFRGKNDLRFEEVRDRSPRLSQI